MAELGETTNNRETGSLPRRRESTLTRVIRNFQKAGRNIDRILEHAFYFVFLDIRHKKFEDEFHLENAIRDAKSPIIEVGGPTDSSWYLTDIKNANRRMFISNITPGNPVYGKNFEDRRPIKYEGKVDFLADATHLPLRKNSVGVLFASCVPREEGFFPEAHRVLEDNALLVTAGIGWEDIVKAEETGLQMIEYIEYRPRMTMTGRKRFDVVFRKTI